MPSGVYSLEKRGGLFQKGHKVNLGKKNPLGKHWKLSEEVKKRMSLSKKGIKFSEEHKKSMSTCRIGRKRPAWIGDKISVSNKGEKSHFWKGGVTSLNMLIRVSARYKKWRTSVFKRDNYTCIWCGTKSGNGKRVMLNADHIKSFSQFPELRFAVDNGRTLCVDCHYKTDNFGSKANYYLKEIWKIKKGV